MLNCPDERGHISLRRGQKWGALVLFPKSIEGMSFGGKYERPSMTISFSMHLKYGLNDVGRKKLNKALSRPVISNNQIKQLYH